MKTNFHNSQLTSHRIKNNLQLVNSLLKIQARSYKDLSVGEFFKKSQNRLTSITIIHENIFFEDNKEFVDMQNYLDSLLIFLNEVYEEKLKSISFDINLNSLCLSFSKAITLGLIINEMIINSIEHAFKKNQIDKKITLNLSFNNTKYFLIYKDNGCGFDYLKKRNSIGIEIIHLLTDQLMGELEAETDNGCKYLIEFP